LGFDNIEISALVEPPLSTVSQPLYEIGALAAKKVIQMIKGKGTVKPSIDFLKTDLIIRKSTR
jgi:LacI family transcriptional regulator